MQHYENAFHQSLLDSEFYEPIDAYEPSGELRGIVDPHLGKDWKVHPGGYWTSCLHKSDARLGQGWKIHLSASLSSARIVLERAVPVIVQAQVGFKFLSDLSMVALSLNKNSARTAAGKFITVYPVDLADFQRLIEDLYDATRDLAGPFLLTDRPFKDSKVVYYRYGEHYGAGRVDVDGRRVAAIRDPQGRWVSDERRAYLHFPAWIEDPFAGWEPIEQPTGGVVTLKERYRVEGAFRFHATGAVYRGVDTQTDQPVIIREARPSHRSDTGEEEGFALLRKEARILQQLGPAGVTAQFVDLFQEWEHLFLVQERLDADSLWGYAIGFSHGAQDASPGEVLARLRDTLEKIAQGLKTVHAHGVVLRDLTRNNVMFCRATEEVKFIDLEFAYELDRNEASVPGFTAGYSSPEQLRNERPHPGEDHYSVGALLVDMVAFTAPGLALNREGILKAFRMTLGDYSLPPELYDVAVGLLEPDPARRWDLDRMLQALDAIALPTAYAPVVSLGDGLPERTAPTAALEGEIRRTLDGMADFILHQTTPERHDRLWPGGAAIFNTNPLSLQSGAAGTAVFLRRVRGAVPKPALDWFADHLNPDAYPPGLFTGLAGIALSLLELGREDLARGALDASKDSPLLLERADLYTGAAGWGLANLHFWRRLGAPIYLERALQVGDHLLATCKQNAKGTYWELETGIPLGFGHGASGVATFLLYLDAVKPGCGFLERAIQAIDFDLAHCQRSGDEVLWYPHVDAQRNAPKSPHTRYGTAGIGSAVLRAYVATGEERLRRFADLCAFTVSHRQTNKLWFDYGLAGFGEYLLDMHWFLGEENYRNNCFHLAEALLPFRIFRPEGIALPAEELQRISTDFSGGMAGIGLFLQRLLDPSQPRFLLLDELLAGGAVGERRDDAVLVAV